MKNDVPFSAFWMVFPPVDLLLTFVSILVLDMVFDGQKVTSGTYALVLLLGAVAVITWAYQTAVFRRMDLAPGAEESTAAVLRVAKGAIGAQMTVLLPYMFGLVVFHTVALAGAALVAGALAIMRLWQLTSLVEFLREEGEQGERV